MQGDVFVPQLMPDDAAPAYTSRGATVSYAGLFEARREPGTRLLTGAGPDHALDAYLAPLRAGGSIVLHAGLEDGDVQRIAGQEGTTAAF